MVLDTALSVVSRTLDDLLANGLMTTNFMKADDTCMYVPEYLFKFTREASTCARFEDVSRDHRFFLDRIIQDMILLGKGHDVTLLRTIRDELALPLSQSAEHISETRALHMARMLDLGWRLLQEAEEKGLWAGTEIVEKAYNLAVRSNVVPFRYKPRNDMVMELADRHRAAGMFDEAVLLTIAANQKSSINRANLFGHAW